MITDYFKPGPKPPSTSSTPRPSLKPEKRPVGRPKKRPLELLEPLSVPNQPIVQAVLEVIEIPPIRMLLDTPL